jgi:hypothetical protein
MNLACPLEVLAGSSNPVAEQTLLGLRQEWLLFDYSGIDRPEWQIPLDLFVYWVGLCEGNKCLYSLNSYKYMSL